MQRVLSLLLSLVMVFSAGCVIRKGIRIYPPAVFVDRVAPIYPDARPQNCKLHTLTAPPAEPYEVFAQVVGYAGSADMAERMEALIRTNACEIGAHAIVLMPLEHGQHVNTDNTYPDWVLESGFGQGGRFPHWVDKRYSVSQRALALIYKKPVAGNGQKPGS
jgi:hypothetical protein